MVARFAGSVWRKHVRLFGGAAAAVLMLLSMGVRAAGASPNIVWTVNNPADPPAADGKCQLREAIDLANGSDPNPDCPPADTTYGTNVISINLVGGGYQTITLGAELPHIVRPVFIDASAEAGGPPPMVGLAGTYDFNNPEAPCLSFDTGSAGSRLVGLRISNCQTLVELDGGGVTLQKNWLGTTDGVTAAGGEGTGVWVKSSNNQIGLVDATYPAMPSNVISGGNLGHFFGIIATSGLSNVIQSNYIGLSADGTMALDNGGADSTPVSEPGIDLDCGPVNTLIGGPLPNQGNVISGWTDDILISSASNPNAGCGAQNTQIIRNKFGTDAAGLVHVGRDDTGIDVNDFHGTGSNTIIGGEMPDYSNLIDSTLPVYLANFPGHDVVVTGNLMGVDANGSPMVTATRWDVDLNATGHSTITNNLITGATLEGIHFDSAVDVTGSTGNCIVGNGGGADTTTANIEDLTNNWWGSRTGPTNAITNPHGRGQAVNNFINFTPWLTTQPESCDGYGPHKTVPHDMEFRLPISKPSPIQWGPVPTASGYHLTVADNAGLSKPIADLDTKDTTVSVGPLGFGTWYWRTTTYTADRFAWLSELHSFTITIQQSPAPDSTVAAGMVGFAWNDTTPSSSSFSFQLYNDGKCGTAFGKPAVVTGLTTSADVKPGLWSWNVTPKGGPTMPCWSFTAQ